MPNEVAKIYASYSSDPWGREAAAKEVVRYLEDSGIMDKVREHNRERRLKELFL